MKFDHSTDASFRLHQFFRLCTLLVIVLLLLASLPAASGAVFTLSWETALSMILGVVFAEIWDQILWFTCEMLVGEGGVLR